MSAIIVLSDDEDRDDKPRPEQRMALDDPTASSDDSDLVVLPTRPGPGIVAPVPAPRYAPVATGDAAPERLDFGADDDSELQIEISDESVHVEPPPTGDATPAMNQLYAVRRAAALAARLAASAGEAPAVTPTETALPAPIVDVAGSRPLVESASTADAYLALEYGCVFVGDTRRVYQQGDEFGFSDTLAFSDGRAYVDTDNPADSVPPKRVANVDEADNHPQQLEAAAYQHAFHLSTGRSDATLPVAALVEHGLAAGDADVEKFSSALTPIRAAGPLRTAVQVALRTQRSGLPSLFAALAPATSAHDTLRRAADLDAIANRLGLPRAAAGGAPAVAVRDEQSLVLQVEDALAETHERSAVPNLLRVDAATGAFGIEGVLYYDLLQPAESLLPPGEAADDKWLRVARLLADRETSGAPEPDEPEPDEPEPDEPEPRRRKLRRRGDQTIASEAGKRKRGASVEPSREEVEEKEPEGSEIEGAAPFDPDAIARELAEEGAERRGVDLARRVDRSTAGYIDAALYEWPMVATPLDWSPVEALQRLADAFGTGGSDVWRSDAAWRDIVELAVLAKLVPRFGDAVHFPPEAQQTLVDTLALVARRVANAVIAVAESRKLYDAKRLERKLRLSRDIAERESEIAALEEVPDAEIRAEVLAEVASLRQRLDEMKRQLDDNANDDLVPPSTVPPVFVLAVAPAAHTDYVKRVAENDVGVAFDEPQRVGLAVAYAVCGRQPRDQLLESQPLTPYAGQRDDALYYPRVGSYASAEAMLAIFADNPQAGSEALVQFATRVGRSEWVPEADAVAEAERGAFLWSKYADLVAADPDRDTFYAIELARSVYPHLVERGAVNAVEHIYCVSPQLTTPKATAAALRFIDTLFNEFGVYDARQLVRQNEVEAQNTRDAAYQALVERGSERLYAAAAQRDVNEHFSAADYVLAEAPLVPANFDGATHKPVGVFAAADGELVVAAEQTEAYLQSRALLGGGRVVVASAALVPRLAAEERASLERRARQLEGYAAQLDDVLASAKGASREALLTDKYAAMDELGEIAARLQWPAVAEPELTTFAPFLYFVAPATLADVCARVASAAGVRSAIAERCARFAAWYAGSAVRTRGTLEAYNQYRVELASLAADLRPLVAESTRADRLTLIGETAATLVREAVARLGDAERPRLLLLPEETTRPDAVVTLPFSCLAALERATSAARTKMRDALLNVWYAVAVKRRWARFGYTSEPFNTSHAIDLPLATLPDGAFDDYQVLYLALRSHLRETRRTARRRAIDPRGAALDEGESDAEDVDEPTSEKADAQIAQDRRAGRLEAQTLLNCLELEIPRVQMAQCLWFDLFAVGSQPDEFARSVGSALSALYSAISSGRGVVSTSLLASRTRRTDENQPLALDPRAQSVVDQFWVDFGGANAQLERGEALGDAYAREGGDDAPTLLEQIDTKFYETVAALAAARAAPVQTSTTEKTARAAELKRLNDARAAENAASPGEESANRDRPSALERIPADVALLVDALAKELAAFYAAEKTSETTVDIAKQQSLRDATAKVRELEVTIRKRYGGDKTARDARVDALVARALELRFTQANLSRTDNAADVGARLTATLAEMRASLYAHERAARAEQLRKEADALEAENARMHTIRERVEGYRQITQQIEALEKKLADAEPRRREQFAKERKKQIKAAPAAERAALESTLPQYAPNDAERAADRALCIEAVGLRVVRGLISVEQLDERAVERARDAALAEAPLCDAVERGELAAETAARGAALLDEARRLRVELEQNAKNKKTATIADARKDKERSAKRRDYLFVASELYPVVDRLLRKRLTAASAAETEAVKSAEATLAAAMAATRSAEDEALAKNAAGLLAAVADERQDVPSTRERARQDGVEPNAGSAYYDAPLANHKKVSIEGLALVAEIVRTARLLPDDEARLQMADNQTDEYVDYVLEFAASVLDGVEPAGKTALASGDRAQLFPAALRRQIDKMLTAAVSARVAARYQVSDLAKTLDRAELASQTTAAVKRELDGQRTSRTLAREPLRWIDRAALAVLQETYLSARRAKQAATLLDSLGAMRIETSIRGITVDVPRLAVLLLLPAAIERAKLQLQQALTSAAEQPWAVANRQDAPQAWRIAEIVERYARTGRLPLPTAASNRATSPYSQYVEIRRAAQPTLAALGRLRFFAHRVTTLRRFGVVAQRVSLGSGLHSAVPLSTDLVLAALCAQLMRLYASVQTAFDPAGVVLSTADVWRTTQTGATVDATRRAAALPSVRERLWCHLAMLFAQRGTLADAAFPLGAVVFGLPTWREMRAVDIRLLALAVLGYDQAPRSDDEFADARYAYTRGHGAKHALAAAYYEQFVETRFATRPSTRIVSDDDDRRGTSPLFLTVRKPDGTIDQVMQYVPTSELATKNRPTTAQSGAIMAQLDESETLAAIKAQIYAAWAAPESPPAFEVDTQTLLRPPEIGQRIRLLLAGGAAADAVKAAAAAAAVRAKPYAAPEVLRIRDQPWLFVPRAVLVGAFVQTALTAPTTRTDGAPLLVFRGRRNARVAARERLMITLAHVLDADDSAHLLRDDARDSGDAIMQLDAAPLVDRPAGDEPTAVAPVVVAPPPAPTTNVPEWRQRVLAGVRRLLALPFDVRFVGTTRAEPFARDENAFAPVPTSIPKLEYAHHVLLVDGRIAEHWNRMRAALASVAEFFTAIPETVELSTQQIVDAFASRAAALDRGQIALGSLLVRAELARRARWRLDAGGEVVDRQRADKHLHATDAVKRSKYQPWHVLVLYGLSLDADAKAAIAAYAAKATGGAKAFADRALLKKTVSALDAEKCIPVHEKLLYHFDSLRKGGQLTLYKTTYRYQLWALLSAPLVARAFVWLETSETVGAKSRIASTLVDYASIGAEKEPPLRAYMPRSYAGYTVDGARAEAQSTPLVDASQVTVVHEHAFRKPDTTTDAPGDKVYAGITVLARIEPLGAPTVDARAYTVDQALAASSSAVVLAGLTTPLAPRT